MFSKIKNILAWALIFFGSIVVVFSTYDFLVNPMADKAIERNHQIESAFLNAANFVDSFKSTYHRLPTEDELHGHLKSQNLIFVNSELGELPEFIKEMPADSYYLTYWRGEWAEYFAGWNRKSTLDFNKDHFYFFGSKLLAIVAIFISLATFAFGLFLKKRPLRRGAR